MSRSNVSTRGICEWKVTKRRANCLRQAEEKNDKENIFLSMKDLGHHMLNYYVSLVRVG